MSSFSDRIIAWQRQHGRHDLPWQNTRDPYAVWVSEIMLQQTQVSAVIPYYQRFMARFPDIASLAASDEDEVYNTGVGSDITPEHATCTLPPRCWQMSSVAAFHNHRTSSSSYLG